MQFSMATNWDVELIDQLDGSNVTSFYGQIWGDPLGGGRMLLFIPKIDRSTAVDFIKKADEKGIAFNYLVNSSCLDNEEFTRNGYRKIREHLDWIASSGAKMVTVTLPFMAQIMKTYYPTLNVCASSFARIQTVQAARYWEDLGAQKLILPELVARDFKTLGIIRGAVACELELIANHSCLYYCPMDLHHRNLVSHASQYGHPSGGFAADVCKLSCQRMKLVDPAELIRSRWIRPEDVGVYEEIGIDCLKLVERFRETKSLMNIWNAYKERQYDGNLAELLTLPQQNVYRAPNVELLDRPDLMDTEKMKAIVSVLREPFTGNIVIDNTKLDGFLDYFKTKDCLHTDCEACGYCEHVAQEAVVIDSDWQKALIQRFDKAINLLTDGKLADYE